MLFFPFHIGDWITGTKLMSAVEKGVYIDLLTYYYSVERPITEDECRRIARAYAGAEQDAMQYVLQNHFAYVDGAYVHKKCEEIISQTLEKQADISEKKRKAARARWNKEKQGIRPDQQNAPVDARAYAGAEQMQSTCNTDAMLTNNHKPITKNINNTNKQLTHTEAIEAATGEGVCFDSSVSVSDLADDLANEETQKVIDDSEAVVNPVQVIGLARMHGIKVYRSDRLNAICQRNILTVDNIRQCIRIAKKENKGGSYLIGILSNAVNEPNEYHTWEYLDQKHKAEEAEIDWDKPFE